MAPRGCLHPVDVFCYVCGQFIKTRTRKYSVKACRKMCEAYQTFFGMPVGDQDKSWALHFTCEYCKKTLEGEMNNCCLLRCSHSSEDGSAIFRRLQCKTARKILEIQITFSQTRLRRGHTSLTRKTSTI